MKRRTLVLNLLSLVAAFVVTLPIAASAATGLTYHGRILKPGNIPLEDSSVDFRIQILSPLAAGDCLIFDETQNLDMTSSSGLFALTIGEGTRVAAAVDGGHSLEKIFSNRGSLTGLTCAGGTYVKGASDVRRLAVQFNDGSGWQTLPTSNISYVPNAIEAQQVAGYGKDQLLRVADGVVATEFSSANWTALWDLITGASTVYSKADGTNFNPSADVGFNNKKAINLADPIAAQDAATKNYVDTSVGGKVLDPAGVSNLMGNGRTLVWDQAQNKWVAGLPVDSTKLPLAGGTMTGAINMGAFSLTNVGHVVIADQGTVYLGKFDATQESTLIAGPLNNTTDVGRTWFNTATGKMRYWDGAVARSVGNDLGYTPVNVAGDTMSGLLTLSGDPSVALGAATKQYVDAVSTAASGAYLRKDGTSLMTGNIQLNGNWLSNDGGNEGVFVDVNGKVGVGTSLPGYDFTVASDASAAIGLRAYTSAASSAGPQLNFRRARGTASAPTQVLANDRLAIISFGGQTDAGAFSGGASAIQGRAAEAFTTIANGSFLTLETTPIGSTARAERLRIDSSGNVGIGTTNPLDKLDVEGSGVVRSATNNAYLRFASNATSNYIQSGQAWTADSKKDLIFSSMFGGTPWMMIQGATGNVGIGTAAPSTALEVVGTIKATAFEGPLTATTSSTGAGSAAAPSYTFSTDSDTGLFSGGVNTIGFSSGGSNIFNMSSSGLVSPSTGGAAVTTAAGTAAAPTFSFAGDLDTGWYSPAADTLAASTAGIERVRIDSTGRIGIGITPTTLLHVSGNGAPALINSANSNLFKLGFSTAGALDGYLGSGGGKALSVGDSLGNERFTVLGDGKVGIGTTAPTSIFHIVGSGSGRAGVKMDDTTLGYSGAIETNSKGTAIYASSASQPISFLTNDGVSVDDRMRILASGNVGIGTVSPQHKLDLGQAAWSASFPYSGITQGISGVAATAGAPNPMGGAIGFNSYYWTGTASQIETFVLGQRRNSATQDDQQFEVWSSTLSGNAEKVRIKSGPTGAIALNPAGGNVGIGTASPAKMLDVAGTMRSTASDLGEFYSEKTFAVSFASGVANQKVQIYWPTGSRIQGLVEITLSAGFSGAQASGFIKKTFGLHVSEVGGNYFQDVKSEVQGATKDHFTISDFIWDATNSRWYVIVSNLGTADNSFNLHIKTNIASHAASPWYNAAASNAMMSAVYATDATVYPNLVNSVGSITATSSATGAGTAAAPSYTFSSDSDTGIYSAAANTIGFAAGGANVFNMSSSGLVSPTVGGGSVSTAAGTAAAPTFSFAGDLDTGWYSPAANTLAASTAGSERVRIDSTGNVGVGTLAPTGKLHVYDSAPSAVPMLKISSPGLPLGDAAPFYGLHVNTQAQNNATSSYAGYFNMITTGQTSHGIYAETSTGSTQGFGVYGKATQFDVNGPGIAYGVYGLAAAGGVGTLGATYAGYFNNTSSIGAKSVGVYTNTVSGATDAASLIAAVGGVEKFRVHSNGNVGIGSAAPSAALHVNVVATNSPLIQEVARFGTSGRPWATAGTGRSTMITIADGDNQTLLSGIAGYRDGDPTATYNGGLQFYTNTAYPANTVADLSERMRITSTGNVGIGTTTPASHLDVRSTITATAGNVQSIINGVVHAPAAASTADIWANNTVIDYTSAFNGNRIIGGHYLARTTSSGSADLLGLVGASDHYGTGTVASAVGVNARAGNYSGAVLSTAQGLVVTVPNAGTGSITNGYGVYIDSIQATNNWGVYQVDATADNYFAGNVGVGTNAPSEKLHVSGGLRVNGAASATNQGGAFLDWNSVSNVARVIAGNSSGSALAFATNNAGTTFERMRIDELGNVGIGMTPGAYKLDITGEQRISGNIYMSNAQRVQFGSTNTASIQGADSAGPSYLLFRTNGTDQMRLDANGRLGIGVAAPTYQLELSTDSAAKPGTSTWTIASDMRLKDIRAPFIRGLAAVEGIEPIYFNYKTSNPLGLPSGKEYVGIRAQDAEKHVPEAVQRDEKGFLHVTNDAIIWTMFNAIKELYHKWMDDSEEIHRELASVKEENAALKKTLSNLEERLQAIEQQSKAAQPR